MGEFCEISHGCEDLMQVLYIAQSRNITVTFNLRREQAGTFFHHCLHFVQSGNGKKKVKNSQTVIQCEAGWRSFPYLKQLHQMVKSKPCSPLNIFPPASAIFSGWNCQYITINLSFICSQRLPLSTPSHLPLSRWTIQFHTRPVVHTSLSLRFRGISPSFAHPAFWIRAERSFIMSCLVPSY